MLRLNDTFENPVMSEKIKISAVSYLNSKPFIYGIQNFAGLNDYSLELDTPSVCASKLLNNKVDIGLIPVAVIPKLTNAYIISDYCIGAKGAVSSVMLYSEVPLQEVKTILLDYQSETSVALTKLLADKYWNINPKWISAAPGYENKISDNTAGLVIGDRTFDLNTKFPYKRDLAEDWFNYTGLPFVFACWVANKKLPEKFISGFNAALKFGVDHIDDSIRAMQLADKYPVAVKEYITRYISYPLDEEKKKGLARFLEEVKR